MLLRHARALPGAVDVFVHDEEVLNRHEKEDADQLKQAPRGPRPRAAPCPVPVPRAPCPVPPHRGKHVISVRQLCAGVVMWHRYLDSLVVLRKACFKG